MVAQIDSEYRQYGWRKTARRLASYAAFEGRPATTRGQWFNPAVFAWLQVLAALPGEPEVDRPVFITGLGRSGTTILGVLLSLHRDVGFLNEPKAMWHVVDPRQDINGNYSGQGGVYRLAAGDADAVQRLRARRLVARYLGTVGASRLVDKYPELIFRVDYVRAIFPDARFVFIYRNGVDACQSIVSWSQRLGRRSGSELEDWWGRNDSKWLTLWSQLVASDPRYVEIAALPPLAIDHANRAALEWIITMREGLVKCAANPGSVVKLCYEGLVARPDEELTRLLQACELPVDKTVLDYARNSLRENSAKAMPKLLPPIARWFEETMGALGY